MYCSGFLNTAFCSWGTGFETGVGLRLHGRQPCWESCWCRRAWQETQARGFLTSNELGRYCRWAWEACPEAHCSGTLPILFDYKVARGSFWVLFFFIVTKICTYHPVIIIFIKSINRVDWLLKKKEYLASHLLAYRWASDFPLVVLKLGWLAIRNNYIY